MHLYFVSFSPLTRALHSFIVSQFSSTFSILSEVKKEIRQNRWSLRIDNWFSSEMYRATTNREKQNDYKLSDDWNNFRSIKFWSSVVANDNRASSYQTTLIFPSNFRCCWCLHLIERQRRKWEHKRAND